jgi:hypothetical protein
MPLVVYPWPDLRPQALNLALDLDYSSVDPAFLFEIKSVFYMQRKVQRAREREWRIQGRDGRSSSLFGRYHKGYCLAYTSCPSLS